MSCTKVKPGPRRTSCLTCRQRRKKCDLSRPCCERCIKGGFECLGYSNDEPYASTCREGPGVLVLPRLSSIPPAVPAHTVEMPVDSIVASPSEDQSNPNSTGSYYDPEPSMLWATMVYDATLPSPLTNDDKVDSFWSWHRIQSAAPRPSPTRRSPNTGAFLDVTSGTPPGRAYLVSVIEALSASIPPSVHAPQIVREGNFIRILHEYQLQRVSYWFMTPPVAIRHALIARLKNSKTIIWTMCLGVKLFQALGQNPRGPAIRGYIGWIDKLEQKFVTDFVTQSHSDPTLDDIADCLLAQLELAYLRFVTVDSPSGYALLQKSLPRFLHLVAADPSLYLEHPSNSLVVSFPRTFSAPRYELKRFVMYDTAASLVLGLPPLVEYGYDCECDSSSHGLEWIHGVPVALVQIVSQINSWRAGSRVTPLDDWEALERRLLSWEPRLMVPDGEDSDAGNIGRLAIQESWRHTVLIYLYMGMCGVSSHDSRVQASIQQIIQLGKTVANLPIGIHMFTHCVIAGIGARLEKHRSLVREQLLSFKDTRVWLFRGPQFSKVLDHMWHGVGAGGAPVMWDDYIRSRRKKCDLTKPCCERCLTGGYECLGYEDSKPRARVYPDDSTVPKPSQLQLISPIRPPEAAGSETLNFVGVSENREDPIGTDTDYDYDPRPSILGSALRYRISGPVGSANGDSTDGDWSEDLDYSWPQDQSQTIVYSRSSTCQYSRAGQFSDETSSARPTKDNPDGVIETLCRSIPPVVDARRMLRQDYIVHVIDEYLVLRVSCWFTTPPPVVRDIFSARVQRSKRMTWSLYLGAKLFQALAQDSCGKTAQGYIGWIDKLDQNFTTEPASNSPVGDVEDRFMAKLEVSYQLAFFKFTVVDNPSGYAILQRALPSFLQLVAADSNLCTERPNGDLVVSFPRTLTAPRYEFGRFMTYDTVAALLLGVPPLVEYGYGEEYQSSPFGLEWIHGIPVVLFEAISQVNSWRAGSRVSLDDWQTLESRVLAWQSPYSGSVPDTTGIVSPGVARFAVQEGWRHVVLIYIYMGMCGVSSHDPRVQASVHRIVQLGEMVVDLPICVQTLSHCIVAGLGARLERHRFLVRKMLVSFKGTRVWLFQGPQFSQVLYHLWHGVGVGGAPVMWDDYVRSRRAIIPI
ncbi:unnamed protein product [Rhizoctonia solani]|uniref:Zn(2)-C6 fungal-type domain-containing protein n=1 Tax=Rhizoctonia solani TaxID=456999 RepID=A0A8H3HCT4_9AGAM|nr:unnamed protein product [Rhizoctonia solani]